MNKTVIALLFLSASVGISAQNSLEDFRKQSRKEYEDFRRQVVKEYSDFRDRANAEYAEFMRRAWEQHKSMPEIPAPKPPDPPIPPVVVPKEEMDKTPEDKPVPYEEVIPAPVVIEQPKPVAPVPEIPKPKETLFSFRVFGTECKVRLADEDRFRLTACTEDAIADAWKKLSQPQYNNLIRDCLQLRTRLNLCDWAYLLLLQKLSSDFLGENSNESTLLAAFIYGQSGYKMRLARSESGSLFLMVASRHILCNIGYYVIDSENFYPLNCREKKLFICNNVFPGEQALSLLIGKEQYFTANVGSKRTLMSEKYPDVTATISSNKNLIDFYSTYPQSYINSDATTKWTFYANTPLSQSVKETLYPALSKAVQGKSEQDAANILINFVQTAFKYEYDDVVWGYDRPFFADETLYYPFSDCEDRAILFSRLIRDLTGLKVVLLYYPGHLATAVKFSEMIPGDYLQVNGQRYLVCDPTYTGANIGMTMTGMDNNRATVVFLE
ncbi:MAG: hypothetical protein LBH32_04055 [Dysgonamonadaceae bacterium]|jgi:hypothetical protein|nr:hypothetical protein [Dysgonamonadaceae bacterium]